MQCELWSHQETAGCVPAGLFIGGFITSWCFHRRKKKTKQTQKVSKQANLKQDIAKVLCYCSVTAISELQCHINGCSQQLAKQGLCRAPQEQVLSLLGVLLVQWWQPKNCAHCYPCSLWALSHITFHRHRLLSHFATYVIALTSVWALNEYFIWVNSAGWFKWFSLLYISKRKVNMNPHGFVPTSAVQALPQQHLPAGAEDAWINAHSLGEKGAYSHC